MQSKYRFTKETIDLIFFGSHTRGLTKESIVEVFLDLILIYLLRHTKESIVFTTISSACVSLVSYHDRDPAEFEGRWWWCKKEITSILQFQSSHVSKVSQ